MVAAQNKMNELKEIIQDKLTGTNKQLQNPVSDNSSSVIYNDDLNDDLQAEIDINIKEKLHAIGNDFFVSFYDILSDQSSDNKSKTQSIHSLRTDLAESSITNRVSNANTIFTNGWNLRALELIVSSRNTKASTIDLAQVILDNAQNFNTSQYSNPTNAINTSQLYSSYTIGQLARDILSSKLENGDASDQEIADMQTAAYSKQFFGINYPLLLKTNSPKKEDRYYSKLLHIKNKQTQITETYRLCSEWYESATNNDRPLLEAWIASH